MNDATEKQAQDALGRMRKLTLQGQKAYFAAPGKVADIETAVTVAAKSLDAKALAAAAELAKTTMAYLKQEVIGPTADAIRIYMDLDMIQGEIAPETVKRFEEALNTARFPQKKAREDIESCEAQLKRIATAASKIKAQAKAAKEAAAAAETDLGRAEQYLIDYAKMGDRCFPKLEPALGAAREAAAKRDAAAFETARKAFNSPYFEFANLDPDLAKAAMPKQLSDFEAKHLKAPLPAKLQKAMAARVAAAAKAFEPTAQRMRQADDLFQRMSELKVEAVPVHKVAEAIEIDRRYARELEDALVGDEPKVRAKLKALAGKLKTKLSGDEMFKRLKSRALV